MGRKGDVTGGQSASFLVKHKAVVMGTLLVATMSIIMYYVMLRIYVITHPISMLLHSLVSMISFSQLRPRRITLCRFPSRPVMPRNHLHLVLHNPPPVHGRPQLPTQHAHQLPAAAPTLIHQAPAALPLHPVGDGGHERGLVFSPS